MAFDYPGIRDGVAEPLLKNFGKPGQISVNVPGTGDPWESQIDNETLYDVIAAQTRFTKDHNNGTLVKQNDVLFIVSTEGVSVDPELANRIIVKGITYQVVRVDPLEPGITTMLWYVHARK